MKQHKWHKEIKAWADGAVIEYRNIGFKDWASLTNTKPSWEADEYRIKSQPKEPQYLKVYGWLENGNITFDKTQGFPYLGKIELENKHDN